MDLKFALFQDYPHSVAKIYTNTKYVEAVQQVKMSKIKSEPKFAECQNLERSPTSAELSIKCRSYGGWRGSHSCPRGKLRTSSTLPSTLLSIMNK